MGYAVIDVEATGFSRRDRIVEIAVVILDADLAELSAHASLIDPGGTGPIGASHVHGITRPMLAGKPTFAQLAERIAYRLDGHVMVAHNWPYDRRMIRQEAERAGVTFDLDGDAIDTLTTAKKAGLPGRLEELTATLGIRHDRAHRALADVRVTAEVLRRLHQRGAVRL